MFYKSQSTYLAPTCHHLTGNNTQLHTSAALTTLQITIQSHPHLTQVKYLQKTRKIYAFRNINTRKHWSPQTVLFKFPDVHRHTNVGKTNTNCFQKKFLEVFGRVKIYHQFCSLWHEITPKNYFLRPNTCYRREQRAQYLIFLVYPGDSSPCSLKQNENTVRYWTTHTVQIASLLPSLDLMMSSGKLCSRWPKANEKYYTARKPISSARDSNVPNQTERIVERSGWQRGLG